MKKMDDGRQCLFLAALSYTVLPGVKRIVGSRAPKFRIGPEPSTIGPDFPLQIRVQGLGWLGFKLMSCSGLGFPMTWCL
jgi:hypothetical protein